MTFIFSLLVCSHCIDNVGRILVLIAPHLILVQFTPFELLLSFALKRDDHETDEDVDHEEGDDYDVDNVVDSYPRPVVLERTLVYLGGVDRMLQNTTEQRW